jgi:hypothetical protein
MAARSCRTLPGQAWFTSACTAPGHSSTCRPAAAQDPAWKCPTSSRTSSPGRRSGGRVMTARAGRQ